MEDYNKIIESLSVRFISAKNINILQPLTVENYYDVENVFIYVHKGEVKFGKEKEVVKENEILFVPGGKMVGLTYGSGNSMNLSNDDFINNKEKFFQTSDSYIAKPDHENITMINFEAKVFDTVNFFASLDIPAFVIKGNHNLISLVKLIVTEIYSDTPGKARVVNLETDHLVVELIRHILSKGLFVEQLATNSTYFKDPRLIDIFSFIKDNLQEDLSNKILANVANVSEDYVGQYFKMLTGINPQDYIEYQRMEMAVNMLRTTKKSIRDIGKEVGYKDTAYFCRRFKMMFGIPAGKMRRRETLMNV
ncbi:AraC family transcriptional regulator [Reichenbachiella carrageenanivorans]|uniref:AraC family transcriptional regulator n=1 Tax=Reichenbachiella carrageenanivorans TaxID=2979869 RepID=A0ABY6D3M9_9BACT|nr:AraC family transcriptional regulator [Reichenbachiella carrageenanivorans]UXX80755.1 AraC family transcriptional regulator [Reichenbachiella carrageenanivorans]